MFLDRPYFMENETWYRFNYESRKFELTDNAPQKAVDSYKSFYDSIEKNKNNND